MIATNCSLASDCYEEQDFICSCFVLELLSRYNFNTYLAMITVSFVADILQHMFWNNHPQQLRTLFRAQLDVAKAVKPLYILN